MPAMMAISNQEMAVLHIVFKNKVLHVQILELLQYQFVPKQLLEHVEMDDWNLQKNVMIILMKEEVLLVLMETDVQQPVPLRLGLNVQMAGQVDHQNAGKSVEMV